MDTPQNSTGKTLVKKLAAVMAEVGRIPKNGTNEFHRYKYVLESDLVEAVRDKLASRSVFVTSSVKSVEVIELSKPTKSGEILSQKVGVLHIEYTFHDGDSGESIVLNGVGEIDQDGGKGLYKAMTGALKYVLMKTFLVATGDDPENDGGQKKQPAKVAMPQQNQPQAAPASKKADQERGAKAASAPQLRLIERLAGEIAVNVEEEFYRPLGITVPDSKQAGAIIDRLKALKVSPASRRKPLTEKEVAQAERAGMKAA
jgi:hypothetical protein